MATGYRNCSKSSSGRAFQVCCTHHGQLQQHVKVQPPISISMQPTITLIINCQTWWTIVMICL